MVETMFLDQDMPLDTHTALMAEATTLDQVTTTLDTQASTPLDTLHTHIQELPEATSETLMVLLFLLTEDSEDLLSEPRFQLLLSTPQLLLIQFMMVNLEDLLSEPRFLPQQFSVPQLQLMLSQSELHTLEPKPQSPELFLAAMLLDPHTMELLSQELFQEITL